MIIPDVNLLVYAHGVDSPQHSEARQWWAESLQNEHRTIGLPWISILGFLRLISNGRIFAYPLTVPLAVSIVRSWLKQDAVKVIVPGEQHFEILSGLLEITGTAANLTTDAHLAALAIEYRAEVASADADFDKFPAVRWFNPLAKGKNRR